MPALVLHARRPTPAHAPPIHARAPPPPAGIPTCCCPQAAALDSAFLGLVSAEAAMESSMSYAAFQGPYLTLKGAVCCGALDAVGAWWTALLVWGSCAGALAVAAFRWLARVADCLAPQGCCRVLRPRDFSLESNTEFVSYKPGWTPPSPEEEPIKWDGGRGAARAGAPPTVAAWRCLLVCPPLAADTDLPLPSAHVATRVKTTHRHSQVAPTSPTIAASHVPNPLDLAGGAAAAAAMAGQAFRLAGQAQEMLDGAARMMTSSRGSSPNGGAYPHIYAPVLPRSPGSPSAPIVQRPWDNNTRL